MEINYLSREAFREMVLNCEAAAAGWIQYGR